MIDSNYIYSKLDSKLHHFFKIEMPSIPSHYQECVDDIIYSINLITNHAHINKSICIFISGQSQTFNTNSLNFTYYIAEPAIHMYLENFIFFNLDKVLNVPKPLRIASYLEELAHVIMNIKNEVTVNYLVSTIYPKVKTDGKCYILAT